MKSTINKILFLYPSVANNPEINKAIAVLNGIAQKHSWAVDFFDTYIYEKSSTSIEERSNTGELKPVSFGEDKMKSYNELLSDLQAKIDSFQPDIIAITCNSYEYEYLKTFWPAIKISDSAITIIGGIHPVLKPDEVAETGLFDMVCIGEGEEVFAELLTKYEKGENYHSLDNIYYRDKSTGKITKNARKNLINEEQLWNFSADYTIFDDRYFHYPFHGKIYRRFRFEMGRGCPFNCNYCANSALQAVYRGAGKFFRTRPLDSIKRDMEMMHEKYKIELFHLDDECLLAHTTEWLNDFFEWYGAKIKKPFILQTRPETITDEKIAILKKSQAPFFLAKIGVESGSERILHDVCNRRMKIEQIVNAFKILHKHKVIAGACFMLGFPYETREDIFKSINLCREINPDEILVNVFQPMPGQKLRDICVQEGYIKEDDPPHFFTSRSILKMPQISQDEIENLRRVFPLYAKLPEKYFKQIELCEKDFANNKELYKELVNLRWETESAK
jgi:radical SAM superfamily enzyme YgiQ (UPF0313 family)